MLIRVSFLYPNSLIASFIYTIVVQLVSIVFFTFFGLSILGFEGTISLYKLNSSLGGYSKTNVIIYFEILKKTIFFLLSINIVGFLMSILLLIMFYISTWQGNKVNRLVCYIFAIFSLITTFFGGILFLFWFVKARE